MQRRSYVRRGSPETAPVLLIHLPQPVGEIAEVSRSNGAAIVLIETIEFIRNKIKSVEQGIGFSIEPHRAASPLALVGTLTLPGKASKLPSAPIL
jgi:hypothetical protein